MLFARKSNMQNIYNFSIANATQKSLNIYKIFSRTSVMFETPKKNT